MTDPDEPLPASQASLETEGSNLSLLREPPDSFAGLDLKTLGSVACAHHQRADAARLRAEGWALHAVQEVARAGWALRLAKGQVLHGNWRRWVEENLLGLSYETARRYIRFVEWLSIQETLPKFDSLSEAYRAAGILPDTGKTEGKTISPSTMDATTKIAKTGLRMVKAIQAIGIDTLSAEDRESLKETLRPIAEFWKKL
ncbi:MAG TPA: hypothetical protein PLA50_01170 [Bacteroidia bacterium]|nr:hypothetical protein [Bacteroidia bacterium]